MVISLPLPNFVRNMAFKIILTKGADDDVGHLDKTTLRRIIKKIAWLEDQDDPLIFSKPLCELAVGDVRFRVGDYRLIAFVNQKKRQIEIIRIGHRREIYL